ncbi:MAG: hypothetical protein WBX00_19555 [Isosphaeraceae bacterium]
MSGDLLGDLLREFYSRYGISGEGPEADLNVSELIAGLSDSTPNLLESDIDLLRRMIADDKLSHVIRECDGLLEEIANNAGDTTLLEEINKRFDDMALDPNAVFHGILWYTQAVQADPRQCEEAAHRSPLRTAVDSGASPIWALGEQVTGATILRLYVALVYLRGDWIRQGIGRATLDSAPSLLRYARLLSNEVIRHLRNSLAHGHITPTCAGLHIKDRDFEAILTPGMLNKICTWIFLLHYSIFMVYARREGIMPPRMGADS